MPNESLTRSLPALAIVAGNQKVTIPEGARSVVLTRRDNGQIELSETARLGDSDVFVKRDASGAVRLVYKAVRLSEARREITNIQGSWFPTVAGYNRLNQIAGIAPITPPSIFANGVEHSNPYVEYDAEGTIKRVIARKVAIGYSPIGTLVAIDTVRHYNFDAYYLQDLQAKAKKFPDAAKYGTRVQCPFDPEAAVMKTKGIVFAKGKEKVWVFKVVKDIEGIWIDPQHVEIQEVYNQHIRHQMFGETIAQNIAWRNALKAHPAISTSTIQVQGGVAEVLVYGYRHELDRKQLEKIANDVVQGQQVQGVEVKHDEGEATAAEIEIELTESADETAAPGSPEDGALQPEPPPPVPPRSLPEMMSRIAELCTAKKIDVEKVSRLLFKTRYANITLEQTAKLEQYLESASPAGEGEQK